MTSSNINALQPLLEAIETGNADTILRAMPEPPYFLPLLFSSNLDEQIATLFSRRTFQCLMETKTAGNSSRQPQWIL